MACILLADNGSTSGSAGLKHTADSSGALSIKVGSGSVTAVTFDASGRMGIGVTPSAWGGVALQIASGYAVSQYGVSKNAYYDGANYKYIAGASYATLYQGGDAHIWYTTTSAQGAGNTITWVNALSLTGRSDGGTASTGYAFTHLHAGGSGVAVNNNVAIQCAMGGGYGALILLEDQSSGNAALLLVSGGGSTVTTVSDPNTIIGGAKWDVTASGGTISATNKWGSARTGHMTIISGS